MSSKTMVVLCALALFIQSAVSQCTSSASVVAAPGLSAPALAPYGAGWGYNGLAAPYGLGALPSPAWPYNGLSCGYAQALDFTPTSGGLLPVSSASAIAPVGISVASDNVYEGALAVAGELPFVGTVGLSGALPTAGAGAVNHQCGNGINAMASGPAPFAPAIPAFAPAIPAFAPAIPAIAPAFGYAGCANNFGYFY